MVDPIKPQFAENEELSRAKAWWKDNGRAIVIGVTLGLSAVIGFNYWQSYQLTQAEEASFLFDQLQGAVKAKDVAEAEKLTAADGESAAASENQDTTASDAPIETIGNDLIANYSSTPYAMHAAFALAKLSVARGDIKEAMQFLQLVLDNSSDRGILHIARLRLASLLLAEGEADTALALLELEDKGGFIARYYELIGDAHLQKNNTEDAIRAYQSSLKILPPDSGERTLIQLKLDNLGI